MVIHALEQALQTHQDTPDPWNPIVSIKAVQASAIIHHFNHQKFVMLKLSDGESLLQATLSCVSWLLCMSWKTSNGTITPSEGSQKHLCEKVAQSYPCAKTVKLLKEAESINEI